MQTKATVISVDGKFAIVETERTSACEGCHKATDGGCSVCSMMGSDKKLSARALNTVGARVGDRVAVESHTGRMLWYAALVFLLPLFLALAGWGIATLITDQLLWHVLGGAIGFVGCFAGIFIYSKCLDRNRCDIEITEILE